MKKIVMDLDAYKGNYAMHCPTEASAWLFCGFLNENGRFCHDKTSYSVKSSWAILKENTVYFFNEGRIGTLATAEMSEYTILEIDDFIKNKNWIAWEVNSRDDSGAVKEYVGRFHEKLTDNLVLDISFYVGLDDSNNWRLMQISPFYREPIVSSCFSAITGKKMAEIEVQKIFDGMGQLVNENMYS